MAHENEPHASTIPPTQTRSQLKSIELNLPKKKLFHLLVVILTCMSIFRLLRFAVTVYSSSPRYAIRSDLLIFGPSEQYLLLSKINAAGTTIILADQPENPRDSRSNNTTIYKIEYKTPAKKAYELLEHARTERACAPDSGPLEASTCRLALTELPREVYKIRWDVIVVDAPISDGPDAPGRMGTIYTAGLIARAGNITDVVVHDVNRMIERWFSLEFLCQDNLVSSKGKFVSKQVILALLSTRKFLRTAIYST